VTGPAPAVAPTLDPQIIGQAERAHKPILERVLARTGTTMNQWVALKLTAATGGTADRQHLLASITGALRMDDAAAQATIAELTAAELLKEVPGETARVAFTTAGRARFDQINGVVRDVIARVYADLPAEDLATAARVLTVITNRLTAEQAWPQGEKLKASVTAE
jgi:DNA-binding MarR family transcriptional regulator